MRYICSIALILLIFFQTAYKPVVVLHWKINQDLITQKYCVNKDRPMMHCDGKCYLAKQLRKLDCREQNERAKYPITDQKLKQLDGPFIGSQANLSVVFENAAQASRSTQFTSLSGIYRFDFLNDCFHPPRA